MDAVGDADIVICDNLARALYLSLKYEFVTPLTSLVVVKPDVKVLKCMPERVYI